MSELSNAVLNMLTFAGSNSMQTHVTKSQFGLRQLMAESDSKDKKRNKSCDGDLACPKGNLCSFGICITPEKWRFTPAKLCDKVFHFKIYMQNAGVINDPLGQTQYTNISNHYAT